MGSRKGPYVADFPEGTQVEIVGQAELVEFMTTWKLHHPLTDELLAYAGRRAVVRAVSYYHGGDELYALREIPGTWHERCLRPSAVVHPAVDRGTWQLLKIGTVAFLIGVGGVALGFLSTVPHFGWLENIAVLMTLGAVTVGFAAGALGVARVIGGMLNGTRRARDSQ